MRSNSTKQGVGVLSLLALLLIGLKLTGYISWSWWIVLLPWYGPSGLLILLAVIAVIAMTIADIIDVFKH